jgi:hypothetical protein
VSLARSRSRIGDKQVSSESYSESSGYDNNAGFPIDRRIAASSDAIEKLASCELLSVSTRSQSSQPECVLGVSMIYVEGGHTHADTHGDHGVLFWLLRSTIGATMHLQLYERAKAEPSINVV